MTGSELVEVILPDGGSIFVEVQTPAGMDVARRASSRVPWQDLEGQISRIGQWIIHAVEAGLPETPDETSVEFGVKITGETGVLIGALAKAGGEATISVNLVWKKHPRGEVE